MGITVEQLLDTPHLRLRLHSGRAGLSRDVTWTHTSDLPEPWQWLTGGELLMTNGMSFPRDAAGQEQLLEQLAQVGASALAIGEQMYCPPLTRRFATASDRLELPVLWIRYPMPFVAISRAVAEASLGEQSQRLMRTARIYDSLRRAVPEELDRSRICEVLAKEFGCPVHVCDRETGAAFFPHGPAVPDELEAAVRRARRGTLTAGARAVPVAELSVEALVADIPTHEAAVLVVARPEHRPLDSILLQHAATVIAVELSHTRLALEHHRRAGAELMAQLLDGRVEARRARRQLVGQGLKPDACVVVVATAAPADRVRELHVALWRQNVPHLLAVRADTAHLLVPADSEVFDAMAHALGTHGRVGVSGLLRDVRRIPEANREAVWAHGIAGRQHLAIARYGHVTTALTGLAGPDDATALVRQWLGPLIDHDRQHQTDLLPTLETFLAHRRSWQESANALHIHRQTVLYRIRRIEQLTGRSLSETADIAQFWLALQAKDLLSEGGPSRHER